MGIKLANLAPAIAEILEYTPATAGVIARFGRDADLLTSGARGRHVPDATALDCARLLIAMMLTQSPAQSVRVIGDFGQLQALEDLRAFGPMAETLAEELFPARQPLDVSIAKIISGMGDVDFAARVREIARQIGHVEGDPTTMFPIDIEIRKSDLEAHLSFCDCRVGFGYKSLNDRGDNGEPNADRTWLNECLAAALPYASAVKSTFRIEVDVLERIAALLHGIDFSDLLDASPIQEPAFEEVG